MKIKITYYLDVASSWCFLAEPAWAALKERYAGRVDFDWKIALMDAAGLADVPRATGMVLPAERNDDALTVHVEHGVAPARGDGISGAQLRRGSSERPGSDR